MNRSRFTIAIPGSAHRGKTRVELDRDRGERLQAFRSGAPGQVGEVAQHRAPDRAHPGRSASGGRARGRRGMSETRWESCRVVAS